MQLARPTAAAFAQAFHIAAFASSRPGDRNNVWLLPDVKAGLHHITMSFWVYILASRPGGTLYVGITRDLIRRVYEHRNKLISGFTKRYGVTKLVYFEQHDTALAAIQREKNIKHWPREWKIDLIVSTNPDWRDLYDEIVQ
jgi:putative endonuclease